jgi:hypothetical protein
MAARQRFEPTNSRPAPDVARYAHRAIDGTIPYFESDGTTAREGRLPVGADPKELEKRGYVFLDRDAFVRTRTSLNPTARAQEEDADALSLIWDEHMAAPQPTPQGAQDVNDPQATLDPDTMAVLQQYMQEGRLQELFQPYQQEQSVLDQQMQLAQGMRQPGSQRATPMGALFGGLANAAGNIGGAVLQQKGLEGQTALGKRQQMESSGRVGAILRALQQRQGIDPSTGLRETAVDDAALADIFAGG